MLILLVNLLNSKKELGAIRLRMQWVHSLTGLVSHLTQWSDVKLLEIGQQEIQIQKDKVERQHELQQKNLQSSTVAHRRLSTR